VLQYFLFLYGWDRYGFIFGSAKYVNALYLLIGMQFLNCLPVKASEWFVHGIDVFALNRFKLEPIEQ
jgi:hypothetical protein